MTRPSHEESRRLRSTHVMTARPPESTNSRTNLAGSSPQSGLLEARGSHPCLIPLTDIGQMDVAEYDSGKTFRSQRTKLRSQTHLHLRPRGADRMKVDSSGFGLRLDHFSSRRVKSHSTCGCVVEVDQAAHLNACGCGALQRQGTVFPAGPHQRVLAAHSCVILSTVDEGSGLFAVALSKLPTNFVSYWVSHLHDFYILAGTSAATAGRPTVCWPVAAPAERDHSCRGAQPCPGNAGQFRRGALREPHRDDAKHDCGRTVPGSDLGNGGRRTRTPGSAFRPQRCHLSRRHRRRRTPSIALHGADRFGARGGDRCPFVISLRNTWDLLVTVGEVTLGSEHDQS